MSDPECCNIADVHTKLTAQKSFTYFLKDLIMIMGGSIVKLGDVESTDSDGTILSGC